MKVPVKKKKSEFLSDFQLMEQMLSNIVVDSLHHFKLKSYVVLWDISTNLCSNKMVKTRLWIFFIKYFFFCH